MFDAPLPAALSIGLFGIILEFISVFVSVYAVRRAAHAAVLISTSFFAASVLLLVPSVPTILIAVIATYRIINSIRVLSGYTHERHNRTVTARTSRFLLLYQALSMILLGLSLVLGLSWSNWLSLLLVQGLIGSFTVAFSTRRNLQKSALRSAEDYISDKELPAISVCIPARNETADLTDCLTSIIASDYPKLEVLVLDDCSQDRTSEIIKGFAQDGVRFIAGEPPKRGWLAKNQAYQALADAASGDILVFCGVDVRMHRESLRSLVATLIKRRKRMISILPVMDQRKEHAFLVQPLRYWWELALPRRRFNRPPVLSTCWAINAQALKKLGGFTAVDNSVVPEAYFAHALARADEYTFMRSDGMLVIRTEKRLPEQVQTALRTNYPRLRKRLESLVLVCIFQLTCLLLPLCAFIVGFFYPFGWLWLLSGVSTGLLVYAHVSIARACRMRSLSSLIATFPLAVLYDLVLLHISAWRYEFGTVMWKDRNICIPVMHVIPRLPKA